MKPPCVEVGTPLNFCARAVHAQKIEGRIELPPEFWLGWRLRGKRLIGPGGMTFTPATLAAAWRNYIKGERDAIEGRSSG